MKTIMFLSLLFGAAFLLPGQLFARDSQPEAAKLFRSGCQHCHTVPDPRQELDRAWLGQVHRTA